MSKEAFSFVEPKKGLRRILFCAVLRNFRNAKTNKGKLKTGQNVTMKRGLGAYDAVPNKESHKKTMKIMSKSVFYHLTMKIAQLS